MDPHLRECFGLDAEDPVVTAGSLVIQQMLAQLGISDPKTPVTGD